MASNNGRKDTPIPRGLVDRIAGAWQGWFGPGQPLTPIAPKEDLPHRWDFPYGINLAYQPRQEQGVSAPSFGLLRAIADPGSGGLDLLRLAIQTRKNQISALKWKLVRRDKDGAVDNDPKIKKIAALLRRPDGIHTFLEWQRMVMEEHFVIDAVALYRRAHPQGTRLEVIDGATIKLLIDEFGRRPFAPLPAYQQFLKGVPAVDYTENELGYYMYDPRADRLYGMSRVEQVINMVTIALARQVSLSAYYTDGSMADLMLRMPKEWSVAQIKEYMDYWNGLLGGNLQQRRQAMALPGDAEPFYPKEMVLKDAFDEWVARIICYAFDLPPTSLVKEQNRSVTETQKESAAEEGLTPTKFWFQQLMDNEIELSWGEPDVRFAWDEEEVVDQQENASIVQMAFGGPTGAAKPWITLAEARDKTGWPPATDEQLVELEGEPLPDPLDAPGGAPPTDGNEPTPPTGKTPAPEPGGGDVSKARRAGRLLHPPSRNASVARRLRRQIERKVSPKIRAFGKRLASLVAGGALGAEKDATDDKINALLGKLTPEEWEAIAADVEPLLAELAAERAKAAAASAGKAGAVAEMDDLLDQANERAVAWASARAAALVTEIEETTRRELRELLERQIAAGATNAEMSRAISDSYLFSRERANAIARTESSFAETRGTVEGWRSSGVVEKKRWAADAEACDECAEIDGTEVGIDEDFPNGGGDGPPLHPNCECTLYAVLG